jgi:hypothetical protein
MERYGEALRSWMGKLTETVRGRSASLGTWIKERMGEMSPRRIVAVVVALSLWMGVGRMAGSVALEAQTQPAGEVFGEVHWYEG